jgi:hypothetical protein
LVRKMTRCLSLSPLGSKFDAFLFAPMGEDRNGMLLSVLTVLARLDIDPWLEAAELARLPEETATQRLTSFIAALPDAETAHPDPPRIAARLIAPLPRMTFIGAPSRGTEVGVTAANNSRSLIYMLCFSVAVVSLLIGVQSTVAGHQASVRVDKPFSDVSGARSGSTPTERVGH